MAKLALTLTIFIALFIFTVARHPLDLPDDESSVIHRPSITLPEPEGKRTILLPSENPESEPLTVVELEHENETHVTDNEPETDERNRDGDERRMFMLRHAHHRCHHPHHRPHLHHPFFFHQFEGKRPMPEFERRERSYGNDMLVSEPETGKRVERRTVSFGDDMLVAEPKSEKELNRITVSFGDDMLMEVSEMEKGLKGRTVSFRNDMLVADTEGGKGFGVGGLEEELTEVKLGEVGGHRHAPSQWVGLHFGGSSRFDPDHERASHHHYHIHHDRRDEDDERRHDGHRHDEERRPDERRYDEERRHGRREAGSGGFVKRIRKFLHQIDF